MGADLGFQKVSPADAFQGEAEMSRRGLHTCHPKETEDRPPLVALTLHLGLAFEDFSQKGYGKTF